MKTVLNINLFWMAIIYIITILLGFYVSITIGIILSVFTIAALVVLNISVNVLKNEKNIRNT